MYIIVLIDNFVSNLGVLNVVTDAGVVHHHDNISSHCPKKVFKIRKIQQNPGTSNEIL